LAKNTRIVPRRGTLKTETTDEKRAAGDTRAARPCSLADGGQTFKNKKQKQTNKPSTPPPPPPL